jgi:internalin A
MESPSILNLSFLSGYPNLVELVLTVPRLSDISVLASLRHLTHVELALNSSADWTPVAQLPHLRHLAIHSEVQNSQLCLLGAGEFAGNLEGLAISLPTSNLDLATCLRNFSNLKKLHMWGIADLRIFRNFPATIRSSLIDLRVENENYVRIDGLEALPNLRILELRSPYLHNSEALNSLVHLEKLTISATNFVSLETITNAHNLIHLDIGFTRVQDMTPLGNFPLLQSLHISPLTLSRSQPTAEDAAWRQAGVLARYLPNLRYLHLNMFHLVGNMWDETFQLAVLTGMNKLQGLFLVDSNMRDLRSLEHLKSLETLECLLCSRMRSINGIELLSNLKSLSISRSIDLQNLDALSRAAPTLTAVELVGLPRVNQVSQQVLTKIATIKAFVQQVPGIPTFRDEFLLNP